MLRVVTTLLLAVCLSVGCNELEPERPDSQLPVRRLSIDVDGSVRAHFLSLVEELAIRRKFQYRIAPVRPDGEHFIVEMAKPEFRVILVNDLNVGTFNVRVYENSTRPFPAEAADAFMAELLQSVRDVAGIRVSEPTPPQ